MVGSNLLYIIPFLLCLSSIDAQVDVSFSKKRGFYNSAINLELSSDDPGATIRYTTNFQKPSSTVGTIYTGAIPISNTTTIRAIAYSTNGTSKAKTHSYIYLDDIIASSYMEPNITLHPTYGPLMEEALKAIPSISIVDYNIASFIPIDQEVEVSAEMMFPDGRKGFSIQCGLETWGGSTLNPKRSYRLEFKGIYGDKKLNYDIFDVDSYETHKYKIPAVKDFDKLLLRAGSQDGLNGEFGNENHAQFLRNRVIMDASIELGHEAPHGRYVHLYVNGDYLGQYHLMERPDASWFESYYGFDKDLYEVRRETSVYWDGNGSAYNGIQVDLNSAAGMTSTNNYIDLENSANYLMMMSYLSGFDWTSDQNSLCGGYSTAGIVPYKFILWDTDLAFGNGGTWHPDFSGDVNYFWAPDNQDGPVPDGMVGHPEYNLLMADKLQCACFEDGILTPAKMTELYSERAAQIDTSLIAESARWGNVVFTDKGNVDVPVWDIQTWNTERNRMINSHIANRTNKLINFQLVLSNLENNGNIYYTLDGTDPRLYGGAINPNAYLYTGFMTLPDGVHEIKARVRVSQSEWSAMCPRTFYVGQQYDKLIFNEIHYNPTDSIIGGILVDGQNFEFVELHNKGNTSINLTDVRITTGVNFAFPKDASINANGYLVLADNAQYFTQRYGFSPDYVYNGKLDNGGESLEIIDPEQHVLDSLTFDDILPWNPIPGVGQYSLALIDSNVSGHLASNWQTQAVHYTPKAQNVFSNCIDIILETNQPQISTDKQARFIISTNGNVGPGNNIMYQAANNIELLEQFEVNLGATFEALISSCN